jgi:hypothetical protein
MIDELKPSSAISLNSGLLLSGNLQQIGPMEWIIYKPSGAHLQNIIGRASV